MKDFKEDCIWMSYRYCIGRKTIAANMHAADIVKYGDDWISENRRQFTARDIRSNINDMVSWADNIKRDGYTHNYDIPSCILKYLFDNKIENKMDFYLNHRFEVNVEFGTVDVYDYDRKTPNEWDTYQSILREYSDYEPWIKLANYLDISKHKSIKVDYKKIHDILCFDHYHIDYQDVISHNYIGIDHYKENPYINSYISPEYIKNDK